MAAGMAKRFTDLTHLEVEALGIEATVLALREVAATRSFLDHVEARLAGHLASLSPTSEVDHARATHTSTSQAGRSLSRHQVSQAGPAGKALAEKLSAGHTSALHLDRFSGVRGGLPNELQRDFDRHDSIGEWAGTLTPDSFARRLRLLADSLRREHGIDRLAEQRAAVRLRTRTDHASGLWQLVLTLDPERAFELSADLDGALQRLMKGTLPDGCPEDAAERLAFLRAHAFLDMLRHGDQCAAVSYRRELMVVVDTTRRDGDGQPVVTWGHGVQPPLDALMGFASAVQQVTIIDLVRGGVVTKAQRLDLGRGQRLASRLQRRALQALHPVCGVDGCDVPFERCHIHHIVPWNSGGRTDLGNLAPLCSHHHHQAHEQRWELHLDEQRRLHIVLPDGRTLTRPPSVVQAA
jgi:hypothetical protein